MGGYISTTEPLLAGLLSAQGAFNTRRKPMMDDQWPAEHLQTHQRRIQVLEGEVAALNWILRAVVEVLPLQLTDTHLRKQLEREVARLDWRLKNATDEVTIAGLEATRNLLLGGIDAAGTSVKKSEEGSG